MKHPLIPLMLACSISVSLSQDLPGFLQENTFNRPGTAMWTNEHPESLALDGDTSSHRGLTRLRSFSFDAVADLVVTWGRGLELPGVYFDEYLPSFFHRRLEFDTFDVQRGRLEWIFTGETGGFTIAISGDSVWVYQRFYDSYALNTLSNDTLHMNRHPEKVWAMAATSYTGDLQSVDVTVNHKLTLRVRINGQPAASQLLLHDVAQHQLRCSDMRSTVKGAAWLPETVVCDVEVDPSKTHQQMLGFGGIGIPTAYRALGEEGKKRWWEIVREYNLLLHREYPIGQKLNRDMDNWDHIEDATVHYYGDNFPNSEISDFGYIKKIQDMGGINVFEFWKLPPWVQSTASQGHAFDLSKSRTGVDIEAYVDAMVAYCRAAANKSGRPPDIVGIQNEQVQTPETWQAMTKALRQGLDAAGYKTVKIHMHNASLLEKGIRAAKAFTADEETWDAIDYAASNMYDYQHYFRDPDGYDSLLVEFRKLTSDKPFLSTELSDNRPFNQVKSYRLAFQMGQLYHKNLTLADASAIMYCWTLLNNVQYSYDMTRSLFGVDRSNGFVPASFGYQERVFGAFSRYILKDMRRIGCESGDPDVLCAAFTDEAIGSTLILMNRSLRPVAVPMPVSSPYTYVESVTQYHRNSPGGLEETVIIQPGEIVTLTNVLKRE